MDKIVLVIIDVIQLEAEFQQVLHSRLQHADRMAALLGPFLRDASSFGRHQLIQHGVVLFELLVELAVVIALADVDDANQIHGQPFARLVGRDVAYGRRLQRRGVVVIIASDADEPRLLFGAFLGRLGLPG